MIAKKIVLVPAAVVLMLLIALATIDLNIFAPKVSKLIINSLAQRGIIANFYNPSITYSSYSAKSAQFFIPKSLTTFNLDQTTASISLFSLLTLTPTIRIDSKLYGGQFESKIRVNNGTDYSINADLANIRLEQQNQIRAFEISGILGLNVKNLIMVAGKPTGGLIDLTIDQGKKIKPSKIDLTNFGAPLKVTIPAFDSLKAQITTELSDDKLVVKKMVLTSSLIDISGISELLLSHGRFVKAIKSDLSIKLSEAGLKEFGSFLPLASSGKLTDKTSSFKLKIEGSPNRPNLSFLPD